ncbi:hypothetical protein [Aureibacter tunicatorum]|nr:hypothetical protein [Aureibacter tunicatorum]BDD07136.1 hypothetical protein AUTU_46190 [Aureibacter tunicatorum]
MINGCGIRRPTVDAFQDSLSDSLFRVNNVQEKLEEERHFMNGDISEEDIKDKVGKRRFDQWRKNQSHDLSQFQDTYQEMVNIGELDSKRLLEELPIDKGGMDNARRELKPTNWKDSLKIQSRPASFPVFEPKDSLGAGIQSLEFDEMDWQDHSAYSENFNDKFDSTQSSYENETSFLMNRIDSVNAMSGDISDELSNLQTYNRDDAIEAGKDLLNINAGLDKYDSLFDDALNEMKMLDDKSNKVLKKLDQKEFKRMKKNAKNLGYSVSEKEYGDQLKMLEVKKRKFKLLPENSFFEGNLALNNIENGNVSFGFSPYFGYKLSEKTILGLGVSLQVNADTTLNVNSSVSYKVFGRHHVYKEIVYVQSEYEMFFSNASYLSAEQSFDKKYQYDVLLGIGGTLPILEKGGINLAVLYRLNKDIESPQKGNPWIIRFGYNF